MAARRSGEPDVVKQQVAAHWNRRAPGFDDDFGHSIRTAAERAAWDRILDLVLPARAKLDALDVGCGTGFLTFELAGRGHRATGVDFAPAMIAQARRKAADRNMSVRLEEADAEQLPFAAGSFDLVDQSPSAVDAPSPRGGDRRVDPCPPSGRAPGRRRRPVRRRRPDAAGRQAPARARSTRRSAISFLSSAAAHARRSIAFSPRTASATSAATRCTIWSPRRRNGWSRKGWRRARTGATSCGATSRLDRSWPGTPSGRASQAARGRNHGAGEAHRQSGRPRSRAPRALRRSRRAPRPHQRSVHGRAAQSGPRQTLERDQRISAPAEHRRGAARRARGLRDGAGEGLRIRLERARAARAKGRRARGDHRHRARSARPDRNVGRRDERRPVRPAAHPDQSRRARGVRPAPRRPWSPMAGGADGVDRPLPGARRNLERLRRHAPHAGRRAARRSPYRADRGGARRAARAARRAHYAARAGSAGASPDLRRGRRGSRQRARPLRHPDVQSRALPAPSRRGDLSEVQLSARGRLARAGDPRHRAREGLPLHLGGARARGPTGRRQQCHRLGGARPRRSRGPYRRPNETSSTTLGSSLRPNAVAPVLFDRLQGRHGVPWLVELTCLIGHYGIVASILNAFEVAPAPDAEALPLASGQKGT